MIAACRGGAAGAAAIRPTAFSRQSVHSFARNGHRRNGCMEATAAGATIAAAAFLALRSFTPLLTRTKRVPKFRTRDLPRAQAAGRPHRMPGRTHKSWDARTDRRGVRTNSQVCRTDSGMSAQAAGRAHRSSDRPWEEPDPVLEESDRVRQEPVRVREWSDHAHEQSAARTGTRRPGRSRRATADARTLTRAARCLRRCLCQPH